MKFSAEVGNGPVNKTLNFGGDPDHRSLLITDPDPDIAPDPDRDTAKKRCVLPQCF